MTDHSAADDPQAHGAGPKTGGGYAALRNQILENPGVVLNDLDVMRALISSETPEADGKVVDLRSIALERLEDRLNRLEDTHRHVIAAAYDNMTGTSQIHKAILTILEPTDFETFLIMLSSDLQRHLRVDALSLCLETSVLAQNNPNDTELAFAEGMSFVPPGTIADIFTHGRPHDGKTVLLQRYADPLIFGEMMSQRLKSSALIALDLGPENLPGVLAFGALDASVFDPSKATDLLVFFGAAFERVLRRWLGS